jgi:hypothetical protein
MSTSTFDRCIHGTSRTLHFTPFNSKWLRLFNYKTINSQLVLG